MVGGWWGCLSLIPKLEPIFKLLDLCPPHSSLLPSSVIHSSLLPLLLSPLLPIPPLPSSPLSFPLPLVPLFPALLTPSFGAHRSGSSSGNQRPGGYKSEALLVAGRCLHPRVGCPKHGDLFLFPGASLHIFLPPFLPCYHFPCCWLPCLFGES